MIGSPSENCLSFAPVPDEIGRILLICIILEYGDCRDLKPISDPMRLLRPLFCINQRRCTDHSRHARSVIKAVARTTNAKIVENATLSARILTLYWNYRSYKTQFKILFERSFNATHCRPQDERVEKRQNEIGRLQSPRKAAEGFLPDVCRWL